MKRRHLHDIVKRRMKKLLMLSQTMARGSLLIKLIFVVVILLITVTSVHAGGGDNSSSNAEGKLFHSLLRDYDKRVRPVVSASKTVNVTLMLFLVRIVNVDEKLGTITTFGWLHQEWIDANLKWNPVDFDGVKKLQIPIGNLWSPNVMLANNADNNVNYATGDLAKVGNDGRVVWQPQVLLKSFCPMDLRKFPHDSQECTIRFSTWYYTTEAVNFTDIRLETRNPERLKRINSPGWKITKLSVKRNSIDFGTEKYAEMIVGVRLQRQAAYHSHLFILPGFFLSLLTMFIFLLPPESGERITLGVGVILGLTILLAMLESYLPIEMSYFPILGVHYILTMSLCVLALLLSILILNFFHRDVRAEKLPHWMKVVLIDHLAGIMFLKRHPYFHLDTSSFSSTNDTSDLTTSDQLSQQSSHEISQEDVKNLIKVLKTHQLNEGSSVRKLIITEWHQAALVLDRLLFSVYLVIILVSTIVIYSQHRNIQD